MDSTRRQYAAGAAPPKERRPGAAGRASRCSAGPERPCLGIRVGTSSRSAKVDPTEARGELGCSRSAVIGAMKVRGIGGSGRWRDERAAWPKTPVLERCGAPGAPIPEDDIRLGSDVRPEQASDLLTNLTRQPPARHEPRDIPGAGDGRGTFHARQRRQHSHRHGRQRARQPAPPRGHRARREAVTMLIAKDVDRETFRDHRHGQAAHGARTSSASTSP